MTWLLGIYADKVPYTDCEVEIKTLSDGDNKRHSQKCCSSILTLINKVVNYIMMPILVDEKTVAELAMRELPEAACVETFSRNNFYIRNPKVMKKVLSYHRNDPTADGIFSHTTIANAILSISNQIFPNKQNIRSINDSIMTCQPQFTKKYRDFLFEFFKPKTIEGYFPDISDIIGKTLKDFEKFEKEFVINDKIRLLATKVMSSLFLGTTENLEEITKATSNIVPWIGDTLGCTDIRYRILTYLFPKFKPIKEAEKQKTKTTIANEVHVAIINAKKENSPDSIIKAMLKIGYTEEQIESMIITLYVAGQDNVSTSLTYALLKLAQDPDLQQLIVNENLPPLESKYIRALICESLRIFCPIGGIGRTASKDLLMTVRSKETGTIISESRIKKGDLVDPMPMYVAKDEKLYKNPSKFDYERFLKASSFLPTLEFSPFGDSVHRCPGWYLYYALSAMMISTIVKNYHVTTSFEGEPKMKKGFLISLADSIPIKLYKGR